MKFRYLVFSVGTLAVLSAWWLLRPAPASSAPAPVASASSVSTTPVLPTVASVAPLQPAVAPQVAAPKAAPVSAPAQPAAIVDHQKDLGTAIPELVRLVQTGDLVTAWQNYARPDYFASIPPERHTEVDEGLRALPTNPDSQMRLQIMAQALSALSGQSPTLNDAGDVATYPVSGPAAAVGLKQMHFQKVDGHWYIANDDLDRIGQLLGL